MLWLWHKNDKPRPSFCSPQQEANNNSYESLNCLEARVSPLEVVSNYIFLEKPTRLIPLEKVFFPNFQRFLFVRGFPSAATSIGLRFNPESVLKYGHIFSFFNEISAALNGAWLLKPNELCSKNTNMHEKEKTRSRQSDFFWLGNHSLTV